MAPAPPQDDGSHTQLLLSLSIAETPKPFRNPNWKPPQRRNKNLKQMIADAAKQASLFPTQNNSGSSTPFPTNPSATSLSTASNNITQAGERLERLGLDKAPTATYTNIESAPSMRPKKKYCDVTGLPAKYTDPKTGLNYVDKEVYAYVQTLGSAQVEGYKAARGVASVLK